METFDIKQYISTYIRRLNVNSNESSNYSNPIANFNTAIAILTNTVIYNDLPLKVIDEFENDIKWMEEGDIEEFSNPFITHLNPESKLFITSFVDEDLNKIDRSASGVLMMHDIAKNHGYRYQICINKEIPKIMRLIKRLHMDAKDVIIMNEEAMNTIMMMNKHYVQNNLVTINQSANDNKIESSIRLRPYQQEYIDFMNEHNRSILKLPCGMGKSMIMMYHIIQHGKLSVILVPNVALVDQFYNNVLKTFKAFNKETPEIHRLSTKYKEVEIVDDSKQQVIIAVYNSFVNIIVSRLMTKRIEDNEENTIYKYESFPYLYIDEAHHIILPSNKKHNDNVKYILEKYMSEAGVVNTDEEDSFMDALNKLPNYTKAFSNLLFMFANKCCQNYAFFSATIEPANFSKYNMFAAIEEGYLCKLNVDILIDKNYGNKEIDTKTKIKNLSTYLSKSEHQSIIIYTSRVKTARKIQKNLPFESAVITGSMSPTLRQECFENFLQKKIRALLTVNCISEGVDLPCADTAIFFDDKHSIINIIQCVGRIMRKDPTKVSSTLVIPAYNDDDIDNIYTNILSTINGELGYGSVDIRRLTNVRFSIDSKHETLDIRRKIYHKIYEYNSGLFNEIALNSKLKMCSLHYSYNKDIPSLDTEISSTNGPDGKCFNINQFVHDNLHLDNEAGKGLRDIYKEVLNKKPTSCEHKQLSKSSSASKHKSLAKMSSSSNASDKLSSASDVPVKETVSKNINTKVLPIEEIKDSYRKDGKLLRTKILLGHLAEHGVNSTIDDETTFLVEAGVLRLNKHKHKLIHDMDKFFAVYSKESKTPVKKTVSKEIDSKISETNPIQTIVSSNEPYRKVLTMDEINECVDMTHKRIKTSILMKLLNAHNFVTNLRYEIECLSANNIVRTHKNGHTRIHNMQVFIDTYLSDGTKVKQPEINRKVLTNEELTNCLNSGELLITKLVEKLYKYEVYTNMDYETKDLLEKKIIKICNNNDRYVINMDAFMNRYLKQETVQSIHHEYKDLLIFKHYLEKGINSDGLIQLINEYYKKNTPDENNGIYIRMFNQIRKLKQVCISTAFNDVYTSIKTQIRKQYGKYKCTILRVDYSIPELTNSEQINEYRTVNNMLSLYDNNNEFLAYDIIEY